MPVSKDESANYPRIAARERGPGPARYGLPTCCGFSSHDFTKHRNPAYSFGAKAVSGYALLEFKKDSSPGPKYAFDPRLTKEGVQDGPKFSLSGRPSDGKIEKTPGPLDYQSEKVPPLREGRAPAYTISGRTRLWKRDPVPAPNAYNVAPMLGTKLVAKRSAPAYTMSAKPLTGSFAQDLAKTPGPAHYNASTITSYHTKPPMYSMQSRSALPSDRTQKPGPGAYSPEKVVVHLKKAPALSLGIRHSEFVAPLIVDVAD